MPRNRGGQKMFSGEKVESQIEFREGTGGPLRKKMMMKEFDESPDV